jgi:choline dehydrogenase-like flavoprotein
MHDCIVIGSGPSGTACAAALLDRGRQVRLLDAGETLEPERAAAVQRARAGVDVLRPDAAPWMADTPPASGDAVPRKLAFGSDFPYRGAAEALGLESRGVGLEPSFAFGGHSNIWGAAVMPYADRDIADWPIGVGELAPHYEAAMAMLGVSAEADDLADEFPLYAAPLGQLPPSAQARALLERMTRGRDRLAAAGVRFGRARVAIRPPALHNGCVACGLCLGGCPYDAIFKTPPVIDALVRERGLDYAPNVVVDTVAETVDAALVRGRDRETGAPFEAAARRVFLATGPIPTTAILLRSANLYDAPVRLKDSQYFLAPLLTASSAGDVAAERLHTLSQIFVSVTDPGLGHHATQFLQIYSYNSLLDAEVRRKLFGLAPLARAMLARLMVVQGYLHSDISGGVDIVLAGRPGADRVVLTPSLASQTRPALGRLMRKLMGLAPQLGGLVAPMLMRVGEPGRGFHSGGSFPMRAAPGPRDTDTLGRPFGWRRVHAVDSAALPSIAATTITLTVMANAHRIGATAAAMDPT